MPLILLGNGVLQTIRTRDAFPRWYAPAAWGVLLAAGGWAVLREWRARTRVTTEGITRQGPLRGRTWAWSDIYDLRVEHAGKDPLNTAPRWPAHLYDFEGRRFRLPHLDEWQLDDPIAEVAALRAAARQHGMSSEQRYEVEERILRRAGQCRGWQWAAIAAMLMLVVMTFAAAGEAFSGTRVHLFLLLLVVPLVTFGALGALPGRHCAARALRLPQQP
ncbi:PH domain-containing protein [Streptomyces sp. NPDC007905]|uniref:PH domain-containing protein n=1 Tax=Streptomyces sp. NPDC007905 TaxID=3364788 RepID=UPI0036F0E5AD